MACFDVSSKMLAAAKARLAGVDGCAKTSFHLIHGDADKSQEGRFGAKPREYPETARRAFDFVYCFDVMVHMDAHAMYRCLKRIEALLADTPDARAFISTSNLNAPDGFARFEKQTKYSVGGFFFGFSPGWVCLALGSASWVSFWCAPAAIFSPLLQRPQTHSS